MKKVFNVGSRHGEEKLSNRPDVINKALISLFSNNFGLYFDRLGKYFRLVPQGEVGSKGFTVHLEACRESKRTSQHGVPLISFSGPDRIDKRIRDHSYSLSER
jgi:hypothetical protein